MSSPDPSKFNFEHQPLTALKVTPWPEEGYLAWSIQVEDCYGNYERLILENTWTRLRLYSARISKYSENVLQNKTEFWYSHDSGDEHSLGNRYCAALEVLDGKVVFTPQQRLVWGLLDLDVGVVEAAVSEGVELDGPVFRNFLALDLVSLVVTAKLKMGLSFFENDDREYGTKPDGSDYVGRAMKIRASLMEAGAKDYSQFRRALVRGNFLAAKAEVLKGASFDTHGPDGLTPLLSAILRKDLPCVQWLVMQGADCNLAADFPTQLGVVVPEEFARVWEYRSEITPLQAAGLADFKEGFEFLLSKGAFEDSEDDCRGLALDSDMPKWVREVLLDGGHVSISEDDKQCLVEEEVEEKPEPEVRTMRTWFPQTCEHGQVVVDWAEEHEPELLDVLIKTPMSYENLIGSWVKSGADPSPLLMDAVRWNDPALVELLLPANEEVMGRALLRAVEQADTPPKECYDYNYCRGALLETTPVDYVETALVIVQLLRDHGARDFRLLVQAAREGDLEGVKRELGAGTPANFLCDGWGSPLLAAITGKNVEVVRCVLGAGADPNLIFTSTILGFYDFVCVNAPIVEAIESGSAEIVKALLDAGADLENPEIRRTKIFHSGVMTRGIAELVLGKTLMRDHEGNTCVHLLNGESLRSCQDLIPELAWNARNYIGETPLMHAISHLSPKALFLLGAGACANVYSRMSDRITNDISDQLPYLAVTPVHAAILMENALLLESLLDAGGSFRFPAFTLVEDSGWESCRGMIDLLRQFQPANFTEFPRAVFIDLEMQKEFQRLHEEYDLEPWTPRLDEKEVDLLSHYIGEDPSRANEHRDLVTPLSSLDLAKMVGNPMILEMVKTGRKLRSATFFSYLRVELEETIVRFQDTLERLDDPDYDIPLVYPRMNEMRRLELMVHYRRWQEKGEIAELELDRDTAMECLRFASDEFYGTFADIIENTEQGGGASVMDLATAIAENLDPGSVVDLGKFYTSAIAKLHKLVKLCET